MPRQFQYWASLTPGPISLQAQSYDHVTFYTWQSKSKSGLRFGKYKSKPDLRLSNSKSKSDLSLGKSKTVPQNVKNSQKVVEIRSGKR